MIKKTIFALAKYLLRIKPISRLVESISAQNNRIIKQAAVMKALKLIAPTGSAKVLKGPFKGMLYPKMNSSGSVLIPKIIGSYESELHVTIEHICNHSYALIVDIGAGEGYYAVGFALRKPGVKVLAYESDVRAVDLCKGMAEANDVDDQIIFKGACSIQELAQLKFSEHERGFIFCDCEGCELDILDPESLSDLKYCDLLVEIHDFSSTPPSSFEIMAARFSRTHEILPINIKHRDITLYPELEKLEASERRSLLSEQRTYSVGWLYLKSLIHQPLS